MNEIEVAIASLELHTFNEGVSSGRNATARQRQDNAERQAARDRLREAIKNAILKAAKLSERK